MLQGCACFDLRSGPGVALIGAAGLAAVSLAAGSVRAEPAQFRIDPEHASVTFYVQHLGFADIAGMFREIEGSFTFDEASRELGEVRVVIATASIDTDHEARDGHLRSADFLDVETYPEMVFEASGGTAETETTGTVEGTLTLRGETRPVTLDVTFAGSGRYPFGDEHYAIGVNATTTIRRSEFGMTYGVDNGLVGDEVRIELGFEGIRED